MKTLHISLLGKPLVQHSGHTLPGLVSRKSQALLCYLAFTGQPHSRQALAGLLWSEMDEEKARRNLRVALTRMKDELAEYLVIQRRTLAFNRERPYWLDVIEFETTLKQKVLSIDELKQATDLYRGPFLDDFILRDAPLFEEWVRLQQEHYRQLAMDGLYRLSALQTEMHQFAEGIETLNRLLKLEPWMEEAHRQLMLLLAISGQRSAALAQYETCAALLDEELGVEPASETTALYQKIRAEEIDDLRPHLAIVSSPPPKTLPPPFQVPATAPHFVGRAKQQQAIVASLQAGAVTAVQAIVGMGGVGKSTLAAQIAAQLQGHFPDGVLWANAATSEPMSVLESWAQLYGYDFSAVGDVESMAAAFRSALADKHVLLVLDDVTTAARIRPLLPSGPHCRVLLTMRDQDLARAVNAQVWPLQELSKENGRLLFRNILGEARVAAEPEAADAICDELANLPLAVEITAQRLKSRPRRKLADLAQRLHDEKERLSLLTISDREVRASFALSWETLDSDLKRVFALLGLFAGRSFAAEAVAHIAEMDSYLLEDRLYALVALSLLREEGQTRYQLHPLLADFAREQLGEEKVGVVNGRFAHYYLRFAQQNQTDYDALRPEWDNLMAAMEAAHTHQLHQTVIQFADALNEAWFKRGRFSLARQGYLWTLGAAKMLNNTEVQANANLRLGQASIKQSDYATAEQYLLTGLNFFEATRNQSGIAKIIYEIAEIATEKSDFEKAQSNLTNCLAVCQQLDDSNGIAAVYYKMADIAYAQGNHAQAQNLGEKALTLRQKNEDLLGSIQVLRLLASVAVSRSDLELSISLCQQALQYCQKINDKQATGLVLYNLSFAQMMSDEFDVARTTAEKGLDLFVSMGDQRSQAQIMWTLSRIDQRLQDYQSAKEKGLVSLKICEELGDKWGRIFLMQHLGEIYLNMEQPEDAHSIWHQALSFAKENKHPLAASLQERLDNLGNHF